MVNLARKSSA